MNDQSTKRRSNRSMRHLKLTLGLLMALSIGLPSAHGDTHRSESAQLGITTQDWRTIQAARPAHLPDYLKASNPKEYTEFGKAVAVDGNTVVVGAPEEDSAATGVDGNQHDSSAYDSGAVYVFVNSGTQAAPVWTQQAYLKSSTTHANGRFGSVVAIDGDTLVVGAATEANAGAVYIFVRKDATWSQQARFMAATQGQASNFGAAVAIDGDTIVVGDAGSAAYVFTRIDSTWSQQAQLSGSNTDPGDRFGTSVDIDQDTIVVGAESESSSATGVNGNQQDNSTKDAGAAYVFVRAGPAGTPTWTQQAYLKASNTGEYDIFGCAVTLDGDTIVVGARREDSARTAISGDQTNNNAPDSGAAYVFTRTRVQGTTTWSQPALLKAPNADETDLFGVAVALDGGILVIGAYWEDSAAIGVNSDQSNKQAPQSGAAYVFGWNGAQGAPAWSQRAYLKASNGEAKDNFGRVVATDGNTIVVGANNERGAAPGVNGDLADKRLPKAGAAYAFRLPPPITRIANPHDPATLYFDPVGHTLQGVFKAYWEHNGGLPVFGYPLTEMFAERNADTGASYPTQYLERQRYEHHIENKGTPYEVLLGRLGVEALKLQGRDWQTFAKANPAAAHYYPETGHAIAPEFWDYWRSHGLDFGQPDVTSAEALALFGYPISEPQLETNSSGDRVLTQWFERARFEYHANNPADSQILLGRLAAELVAVRQW